MAQERLRRVLTFWPLVLYGLSVIVGAGIYVALGAVILRAGEAAPLSFLLAGLAAGLTGLCYAELSGRFPEASGGVAFIRYGFRSDRLAQAAGLAITLAVAVGAASIARGAVQYLGVLVPLPAPVLTVLLVAGFTVLAAQGIRESVGVAAVMGAVEIAGLLVATAAALLSAPDFDLSALWPTGIAGWQGVTQGAFIAFFAFVGFETLANLGGEVRQPERTLPRGILSAVLASLLLYLAVSTATVLAERAGTQPLLALFEGRMATAFAAAATLAVANGVLVQIVMLARLFYGMAERGQLPAVLATVGERTRAPTIATALAGLLILFAALALPFEHLLVLTNGLTLLVFALVDISLWLLRRREAAAPTAGFTVPGWLPLTAALIAVALIGAEIAAATTR